MQRNPYNVEDLQTYTATPMTGYTLSLNQIKKRNGLCQFLLVFTGVTIATPNSWTKIATLPIKPILTSVVGSAYNADIAQQCGEVRVDSDGSMYVSVESAISGIYLSISLSYLTND